MREIMKDVAQECIDAAIEANNNQDQWDDSGDEGVALLALIGFLAYAFSFLFNLAINEDDHVQNRNFIFDKAALVNLTKPHLPNETSFIFDREGKAGRFEVWVKFYPLAGPTGSLQTTTFYAESWWTPPQTVSGKSVDGSGMTVFKNDITCVYRDRDTQHLMVTKLPPGSGKLWTVPARISVNEGGTAKPGPPGRPSLAVFKDKLFCAFRKLDGRIAIIHTEDNHSWKGQTNIGLESKGYSPSGPALGAYDGAIYCVIRGMDNRTYSLPSSTGTIWYNDFTMFSGSRTQGAPAVCVFDKKLQIFQWDINKQFYLATYSNGNWGNFSPVDSAFPLFSSPAVAVRNDKMCLVYRGEEGALFWRTRGVSGGWSGKTKVQGIFCESEQGLCFDGQQLWCIFPTK